MRYLFVLTLYFSQLSLPAQELFVYSEPASNMAAHSVGFRLKNLFQEGIINRITYSMQPEIMWGVSRKVMIHGEGYFSNRTGEFIPDGAGLYMKYRFYSRDDVHSHFRMAFTGRLSLSKAKIDFPVINLEGQNSGFALGWIGTFLKNKVSLSQGITFLHALDKSGRISPGIKSPEEGIEYNISVGKLLLPKNYVDYKQVNLNAMLELLGQTDPSSGNTNIDLGMAFQLILYSQARVDAGYRFGIIKRDAGTGEQGFLVRLEYNIFNAY